MDAAVTVRLAEDQDLDQLADLFDQYRQFYECPPDLGAAKSWIAENFEKEAEELIKQDCKEVLFARAGDRNGMRFAWFDPGRDIGHLYEIYDNNDNLKNFYSYVYKASLEWDGTSPVRHISEIG